MLHGPLSFQGFARTPLHNYHLCIFAHTDSLAVRLKCLGNTVHSATTRALRDWTGSLRGY